MKVLLHYRGGMGGERQQQQAEGEMVVTMAN